MMQVFSYCEFSSDHDDKDVTANTDYTKNNYSNVFSILLQVTIRFFVLAVFGRDVVQCNVGSIHVASKDSDQLVLRDRTITNAYILYGNALMIDGCSMIG